ncbi:MAG: hypothetical protein EZS28_054212, partial [Streblomastix strix]
QNKAKGIFSIQIDPIKVLIILTSLDLTDQGTTANKEQRRSCIGILPDFWDGANRMAGSGFGLCFGLWLCC